MSWSFEDIFEVDNDTCLPSRRTNGTGIITNIYEGIPETLILSVVSWFILLLLFALLRNRAWDYGRLALVQNEKWTQLFYKNTEEAVAVEESTNNVYLSGDTGFFTWFVAIFKINKQRLFSQCGPDAAHYLSFQKYLLILSAIITAVSVGVILPINFQGTLQGDKYTFGHTTLNNLEPNSKWLWVHVVVSFFFVPLSVLVMRKCSSRIPTATVLSSKTVMITHISRRNRNIEDIRNFMSLRYPDIEIKDVQMAYKVKELMMLEEERECANQAKGYCLMNNKVEMKVQPRGCIICCPWQTQNALEYYVSEEERLIELATQKRVEALQQPLGVAFVTVGSEDAAQYIIKSFMPGTRFHWNIVQAPSPSDILWENLEISSRNWYSKAIFINFCLFIVLFFLTTPAVVVSLLNTLTSAKEDFIKKFSPVVSEFLPTLLLLSMSAIMPVIVSYSDEWMSHWTKSEQNFATMQKTFYYLLFMVLILPSLGLTSAQALVEWSVKSKNRTYRWECVFLPDKGAFFVNYVITSAFIGTALELLRFPELAMYAWRLVIAKSQAEKISIQKNILSEFPFGIHYAWTLLIFTASTVYSLTCPLITPFGLIYLSLKHVVDKHNLFYVYRPSSMCGEGQKIHTTAVRNVRVAVILLQIIMAAFAVIRGGIGTMSVTAIIGLLCTFCFLIFMMGPFPSCKPTPMSVSNFTEPEKYVAPVLTTLQGVSRAESAVVISSDYGSSNVPDFDRNPVGSIVA